MSSLNIYSMHAFLEMHGKMTANEFSAFKRVFHNLLDDNKPEAAQDVIDAKLAELEGDK